METISNIANAASKAIFGEGQTAQSHEEPVSGKMGNVAAGEPYDAGNIGEPNEAALSATEKKETEAPEAETEASTSTPASEANKPAITTTTTGTSLPPEAATKPRFVPVEEQQQPQTITGVTSSAGPAATAPSATSMNEDSTKAQNDTRPPPPSSLETEAKPQQVGADNDRDIPGTSKGVKTSGSGDTSLTSGPDKTKDTVTPAPAAVVDETKDKTKEKTDLKKPSDDEPSQDVKLEGPGPRPLEEIAREHGGDAGAAKPESVRSAQSGAAGGTGGTGGTGATAPGEGVDEGVAGQQQQQQRRDSGKGLGEEEGGEIGGRKMGGAGVGAAGAGAGEQYVKSSGLAADGGDFDAAKPGAGKEADRLLEQKGVHKDAPGAHHHEAGGKEKVGLKDKIKAKLHKNTMSA